LLSPCCSSLAPREGEARNGAGGIRGKKKQPTQAADLQISDASGSVGGVEDLALRFLVALPLRAVGPIAFWGRHMPPRNF
jgi:hypothetical protein